MPAEPAVPDTPLGRFILETADRKGLSIRQVALRGKMDASRLRYYTRTTGNRWSGRSPLPQQLVQQIADGLDVPMYRVMEQVLASTGTDLGPGSINAEQQIVVNAMSQLDRGAQRVVADVVMTLHAEFIHRPSVENDLSQDA